MAVLSFSSRRRHTIFDCDWSSDVCSSDLATQLELVPLGSGARVQLPPLSNEPAAPATELAVSRLKLTEIGRASCRERVEIQVVAIRREARGKLDRTIGLRWDWLAPGRAVV